MKPTATQGTDRNVLTKSVLAPAAVGTVLLAAQTGVVYRVVGCHVSMSAAGTYAVYHGAVYAAAKVVQEGFLAANTPDNSPDGDWAEQSGVASETVQADVTVGSARIVLHYIEIRVLG